MKQIDYWKTKIREANNALGVAVIAEIPLGSTILYKQGKHTILAVVIDHGYFPATRIKVQGESGKEYWINTWRVRSSSSSPQE